MPVLDWIGKQAVVKHHRDVPYRLLEPVPKLSCGDATSGNLIVQGDNLSALKALLPRYAGQVKCIYIDPPYNTGNEGWAYNDNVNSPEIRKWLGEVVGKEGETLDRHDRWLCMMYPRLVLLKQFLREDGVILMSLDGNEHRYAELLFDEIFGAANRIETFIWKKSYGGGSKSKQSVNLHEYVLCFARDKQKVGRIELPPEESVIRYYRFKDEKFERRGPYRLQPLATNSMDIRPNLSYPIPYNGEQIWPERQWQWSKERALTAMANNELVIRKSRDRWSVNYKQYLRNESGEQRGSKLYSIVDAIYTQQGTNELKGIFGDGKTFDFPKPSALIKRFLQAFTTIDALVLDSFAGSGSTGHAVLQANAEDGGQRRFILVEMDPKIARDVTAERVRRVAQGYTNAKGEEVKGLGGDFQFCTLSDEALFTAEGQVRSDVTFAQLAEFVWFVETGAGLPVDAAPSRRRHSRAGGAFNGQMFGHPVTPGIDTAKTLDPRLRGDDGQPREGLREDDGQRHKHADMPEALGSSPLLGTHEGRAVYLLYNGILKDKSVAGGNVLTSAVLNVLPPFAGPRVIYAAACRLGAPRLTREGIVFKQTPYALKA